MLLRARDGRESVVDIDPKTLQQWFRDSPGRILGELECAALKRQAGDLFGYHMIEVSALSCLSGLADASRISHYVTIASRHGDSSAQVVGAPTRLPVASDSVAAVLLRHTLDFSSEPHQVLREAERVLIPEGRVIVVGFNPWSLWGLSRLFRGRQRTVPWNGNFLSLPRINDWLSLLGFDMESTDLLMFRPPLRHEGTMSRLGGLETFGRRAWPILAGVYVVRAVKRVSTLTPVEPRWKARARILGVGAIEPTTRAQGSG